MRCIKYQCGHIYLTLFIFLRVNLLPLPGLLYSPGQFLLILKNIKNRKHSSTAGGVAALTALHRDEWTRAREKLMGLSESNRRHVLEIQDAVLCIALGDIEVQVGVIPYILVYKIHSPNQKYYRHTHRIEYKSAAGVITPYNDFLIEVLLNISRVV